MHTTIQIVGAPLFAARGGCWCHAGGPSSISMMSQSFTRARPDVNPQCGEIRLQTSIDGAGWLEVLIFSFQFLVLGSQFPGG